MERLDEAARLLLVEMFQLGLFEDPYVDPERADEVVAGAEFARAAEEAHRRSVVLAKNHDATLPLRPEDLTGRRVYVELFEKDLTVAKLDGLREQLAAAHPDIEFTTDHRHADVAVVFANPFTGDYFSATGLMDLEIHEATNVNLAKIRAIRESVDTLVIGLNVILSWLPGNLEELADAFVLGFDTRTEVLFEAILGEFSPTGTLPLTLPISAEAIAVDAEGICASPNDVPGYDKERFMDGAPYVYVDADGNRYRHGHGLSYT